MSVSARVEVKRPSGSGYLPTLDGWRALAILMVMLYHGSLSSWHGLSNRLFYERGNFGVYIFFAISGLLITTRLLDEEIKTGSLHLQGFYIRRLFRIQPAALLFLGTIVLFHLARIVPLSRDALFSALFLYRNYRQIPNTVGWITAHFWSLAVEEHFYLLLPAFLLFVRRRRAALLGAATFSLSCWIIIGFRSGWVTEMDKLRTDVVLPRLLLPAMIAVLLKEKRFREWAINTLTPTVAFIAAALFLGPELIGWKLAGKVLAPVAPTLIVTSTMLHPAAWVSKALEWPPLKFIGRISYSLYLWQQLFIVGHYAPEQRYFGVFSRAPLNWCAIFAVACASYYLVEIPFQKWGKRFVSSTPRAQGNPRENN